MGIEQIDDKKWVARCDFEGCDWSKEYSSETKAVRGLNGHSAGHNPSTPPPPTTDLEDLTTKGKFKNCLSMAGIKSKIDAYTELFFRGDIYENPTRLYNILSKGKENPVSIDLALELWYGKPVEELNIEKSGDEKVMKKEEDKSDVSTLINNAIKKRLADVEDNKELEKLKIIFGGTSGVQQNPQQEQLVDYIWNDIPMKITIAQLQQFERLKMEKEKHDKKVPDEEKKLRVLEDGSTIKMTDSEWADYRLQSSRIKIMQTERIGGETKETVELKGKVAELEAELRDSHEGNRFTQLKQDIMGRIDEVEARVGYSDIDYLTERSKKLKELGITIGKTTDEDRLLSVELEKLRGQFSILGTQMQNMNKTVNTMLQTVQPIVTAKARKMMKEADVQDEGKGMSTSEMEEIASGATDVSPDKKKRRGKK